MSQVVWVEETEDNDEVFVLYCDVDPFEEKVKEEEMIHKVKEEVVKEEGNSRNPNWILDNYYV
jgi:hypothetical protein